MARARQLKPQLPPLDTGPVPLAGLRTWARKTLLDLLDGRRGRKALVLDPSLTPALGQLDAALPELLAEHGVARLLYLDDLRGLKELMGSSAAGAGAAAGGGTDAPVRSVVFLVRPTVEAAQHVAEAVRSIRGAGAAGGTAGPAGGSAAKASTTQPSPTPHTPPTELALFFVPRRTITCERVLEEEGVAGDLSVVGEWGLELVALEDDVVSLELGGGGFKECVSEGDSSPLFAAARAVMRLQSMFGLIPRLTGKGPAAAAVRDMVVRMRHENPGLLAGCAGSPPRIGRAILLDREVDLITPMMTQITFEGLIDEVTGIKGGAVPWAPGGGAAKAGLAGTTTTAVAGSSTLLNSTDPFYKEFRDLPYHIAITRLTGAAREARREYSELGGADLAGLKTFVKGLPSVFLLERLSDVATPVAAQVKQQLFHDRLAAELAAVEGDVDAVTTLAEELIHRGTPLLDVLRLMVLGNETGHGLPKRALDLLRQEICCAYGHSHMLTLNALERAGFLRQAAPGRSPFSAVRKALRLVVQEPEGTPPDAPPSDISHLYKGYAPLSIRLVESALRGGPAGSGWSGPVGEAMSVLPGPAFDILQGTDPGTGAPIEKSVRSGAAASSSSSAASGPGYGLDGVGQGSGDVVLVVFLGGVTFSEISALRWLSQQPDFPYRFLVLTTKIITGKTLLAGFVDSAAQRMSAAVGLQ